MTVYLLNTKVESFLTHMYFYINVYKNRLCMHWSHFWLHFSIINNFANFRRSRVNVFLIKKINTVFIENIAFLVFFLTKK